MYSERPAQGREEARHFGSEAVTWRRSSLQIQSLYLQQLLKTFQRRDLRTIKKVPGSVKPGNRNLIYLVPQSLD